MMENMPVLDPREAKDILDQIEEKAKVYTPEWKFDSNDIDAGYALATIFSNMFSQTLDRYNDILFKNYIEFLNLLNVRQKPVTPAYGYVTVDVAKGTSNPVELEKDTIFFHDSHDGERIVYYSDETLFASEAGIVNIFSVVPNQDSIAKIDRDQYFFKIFHINEEDNIQSHIFEIFHNEVFDANVGCEIEIEICNDMSHIAQLIAESFVNKDFAKFEYFNGENFVEFENIRSEQNKICIQKPNEDSIMGLDNTSKFIRCSMKKSKAQQDIDVSAIKVASTTLDNEYIYATSLYSNDTPINISFGGYCFNDQMSVYDSFYIGIKNVFNKRGAEVFVELRIEPVLRVSEQQQEQYEFKKKFIIEKNEDQKEPEKKYISKVVWEYYNGIGWQVLNVEGEVNCFQSKTNDTKRISFTCPYDIHNTIMGASDDYFIRARIERIENAFDIYATTIIPTLKWARAGFKYYETQYIQGIKISNNLNEYTIDNLENAQSSYTLFESMKDTNPSLYLCFDVPVWGYPFNLYFDMVGMLNEKRSLAFEVFDGFKFASVKVVSDLDGFKKSGLVSIFIPNIMKKTTFFGKEGYYLRIVDMNSNFKEKVFPKIKNIVINAVHVTQREIAQAEYFSTAIHDAGKEIILYNKPVLDVEVWVDEIENVSKIKQNQIIKDENIREVYTEDMQMKNLFVKYEKTDNLAKHSKDEKVFEIDEQSGIIKFGDGKHGCIVPKGEDNIKVEYSFGGGAKGNIRQNEISGIQTVKAGITGVTNFIPICGGNDLQSIKVVSELGAKRLKHRGKAVSRDDFECQVKEEFSQVKDVKCFSNIDRFGKKNSGYVTVVVLTDGYKYENHALSMCESIRKFLHQRCDGGLVDGKLAVIPAKVITVNVTVYLKLDIMSYAASTEREIVTLIDEMLNPFADKYKSGIDSVPNVTEFYQQIKKVENVKQINNILLEGSYFDNNTQRVVVLDAEYDYKFAVPNSGRHTIHI